MQIKVLSKIIGENAAVGLVGLLFGDEGKIDFAEQLDSERLLSAVNSEANMDVRLKKASVLIATLKTSREKLMKKAKEAADKDKENPDLATVKVYAAQIADLDKTIATLQMNLDTMIAGKANASKVVNQIQATVHANLVNDQITLSKKEFNQILTEQVEFTQDMVSALPKSNMGSKLRKSVEDDVEKNGQFAESKLAVLRRLMEQQPDADSEELDDAGEAVMEEILGK